MRRDVDVVLLQLQSVVGEEVWRSIRVLPWQLDARGVVDREEMLVRYSRSKTDSLLLVLVDELLVDDLGVKGHSSFMICSRSASSLRSRSFRCFMDRS